MKKNLLLVVLSIFSLFGFAQAPANDNCTAPQVVIIPASGTICINSTNINATSDLSLNLCQPGPLDDDVWFTYIATGVSNTITVTPTGATPAQSLVVSSSNSNCATATYNVCNAAATAGGAATINYSYVVGTQVWVNVATLGADGTFQICITSTTPPPIPGGDFTTATILCNKNNFTQDPLPVNFSAVTPSCFFLSAQQPVFYQFTVGVTGTCDWLATPTGLAEYDWAMFNVTGGCPGIEVACNYNLEGSNGYPVGMQAGSPTICPNSGAVSAPADEICPEITVTAGQTYVIMIDNFSANNVGFNFAWGGTFQMAPTSAFTVSPTNACGAVVATITNTSVAASTYSWHFGDGTTSIVANPPPHLYSTPGTYLISLTTTSALGCSNTASASVTVNPTPTMIAPPNVATCTGSAVPSVVLNTVPTGGTFSWSNNNTAVGLPANGTGNIPAFTATNATASAITATITITPILNGCPGTSVSYTITVNPPQSSAFTYGQTSYCQSGTNPIPVITGVAGGTFTSAPAGLVFASANGTINLAASTLNNYTITYTSPGPCGSSSTFNVSIVAGLSGFFSYAAPFCNGGPNPFPTIAVGATSGTFSSAPAGLVFVSNITGQINLTASAPGSYTILNNVPASGSCPSVAAAFNLTIDPSPTLVITSPAAACSPATVDITAASVTAGSTAGTSLTYWTNATATTSLATPTAITTSGTFYIQSANATCSSIAPVTVTVNTTPVLSITSPAAVCSPSTVNITAASVTAGSTGGGVLSYWTNATATTALATPAAVATSGTYYIESANSTCTDIKPVTVTINSTPTLSITSPAAVCSPASIDISAASITAGSTVGTTLSYWTNATATAALATPTAVATSGTYYIESTAATCSVIAPVTVTVNTTPILSITSPAAVCSPSTVNITAAAVTAGSTGGGVLSYWSNATATTALATPTAIATSGTYYIESTNATCTDIQPVTVTINPTPTLTITSPAAVCTPSTVDITTAAITAGSTGGGALSYWTNAAATAALAAPTAVATTGTYYIESSLGTCTAIAPVNVTVNTTPVLSITSPAAVCSPLTIDITAPAITAGITGGGALSYWTNAAATTPLATPTAVATSGTYYIESTNATCSDIQPVTVTINPTPTLTITSPAAACSPATIDITAAAVTVGSTGGGALSYWTNVAATTALATPTAVTTTGTYYIESSLGTCTAIAPVNVTVNTTPVLSITNPASVCSPATVDITTAAVTAGSTGGGVLSYWTDAAATVALATPTAVATSGTYYIESTNATCTDIQPVTVTINPTPTLTITSPVAVCSPATIDITAAAVTAGSTAGTTLSYWTNAAATTALATPTAVATTGTYYIESTAGTCSAIAPVNVTVNATPALSITSPAAVCSPGTVNITVAAVTAGSTGGGTLSYWTDATATTALATPTAVATSGTYYIESTNVTCTDIQPVTVTINPTPTLTITSPAAVCSPATVDITAAAVTAGSTGGGVLSYWTNATATAALGTPAAVATSGTYYIESLLGVCNAISPVTVTVNITPVLSITSPAAVCSPDTVNITVAAVTAGSTGGGVLSYWTDATATTALATPTAVATSGTYYIEATAGTCTDIAPVTVTINATPTLVITNPPAVCSPATVDITAASVTAGSTGGGVLTYWTNAAATIPLITPAAVSTSGTYYIKSTNGTCSVVAPVIVTINITPVLVITNPPAACAPATVDITAVAVTAGSTGGGILSYWTNATATTSLATPSSINTSGIYYIQSASGTCRTIAPVTATINPSPVALFIGNGTGCVPVSVTFTDQSTISSGSIAAWNWTFGDGNTSTTQSPTHTYTTGGTYSVTLTVTSNTGCTGTLTVTNMITVTNPPVASFTAPFTTSITNPLVQFSDHSVGGTSYFWNFGDINSNPSDNVSNVHNPTHTYSAVGTYCVLEVVSNGSCSDTAKLCLVIAPLFSFYVPNAFSPNGDGTNDEFYGKGENIANFSMSIYDRWGNLLFHTEDINTHWDGTVHGNIAQEDVYVYVINIKDNMGSDHKYIGSVTLVK
jgi:gliding motility-associated-like protein